MEVLIATLVGIGVVIGTWHVAPTSSKSLWTIFGIYIAILPIFAGIYHWLYAMDTEHFVFMPAIAEKRAVELNREQQIIIQRLQGTTLRELLAELSHSPRYSPERGGASIALRTQTLSFRVVPIGKVPNDDGSITCKLSLRNAANPTVELLDSVVLFFGTLEISNDSPEPQLVEAASINDLTSSFATVLYRRTVQAKLHEASSAGNAGTPEKGKSISATKDPWRWADFLYFSVITQATIGYGDIVPNSRTARLLVMSQVVLSVALLTVILTYAAAFIRKSDAG